MKASAALYPAPHHPLPCLTLHATPLCLRLKLCLGMQNAINNLRTYPQRKQQQQKKQQELLQKNMIKCVPRTTKVASLHSHAVLYVLFSPSRVLNLFMSAIILFYLLYCHCIRYTTT